MTVEESYRERELRLKSAREELKKASGPRAQELRASIEHHEIILGFKLPQEKGTAGPNLEGKSRLYGGRQPQIL